MRAGAENDGGAQFQRLSSAKRSSAAPENKPRIRHMMLWVDHHCELAGMLNQVPQGWLATQHWYDFARILPEAQHVIVVGREQLRQHVGRIRELIQQGQRVIFSNPAEGAETFEQHVRWYGVQDLVSSGQLPCVVGGTVCGVDQQLLYDHFLTQPFRYQENCVAALQAEENFGSAEKPYDFLMLNGRSRPHRRWMLNQLHERGLLNRALYTCLDSHMGTIRVLPPQYEVSEFRPLLSVGQQGFVKNQLFGGKWGEIYINALAYRDSGFSLITETVAQGDHSFRTEKIAKALAQAHPWIVVANRGFVRDLRNMGFQSFGHVIDESYDEIDCDQDRWQRVVDLVQHVCEQDSGAFARACKSVCEHNQQRLRELHVSLQCEFSARFWLWISEHWNLGLQL